LNQIFFLDDRKERLLSAGLKIPIRLPVGREKRCALTQSKNAQKYTLEARSQVTPLNTHF